MVELKDFSKVDYGAEVKRYSAAPDAQAIAAIQRHLGIALQKKDSALVACSDPSERKRVVDSFLVKKLGLKGDPAALEKSVEQVCQQMKGDHDKLRVTFYYLLAEKHGKLAALR